MGRGHNHARFTPVEHIPFGEEITDVTTRFAARNGLECKAYYHDLPVWIVHEPEDGRERVRRVQIIVYLVNRDVYLSLVPSINIFTKPGKVLVPKQADPERFPLKTIPGRDTLDEANIFSCLEEAWQKTASLQYGMAELMEVEISEVISAT